jgi:hypothetical protein
MGPQSNEDYELDMLFEVTDINSNQDAKQGKIRRDEASSDFCVGSFPQVTGL